jgi:thiamine-phosphate pyrophosphorylase
MIMNEVIFILNYESFKDRLFDTALKTAPYADKIWFRIKSESAAVIFKLAKELRNILPDKYLILSERPEIAHILNYNAVHLNHTCSKLICLKKIFTKLDFGYSAHTIAEIKEKQEFDYFTLSPIFMTDKPYEVKPLGVIDVSSINKKIYALGGINISNVNSLKNKGYSGIAGISLYKYLESIKKLLT